MADSRLSLPAPSAEGAPSLDVAAKVIAGRYEVIGLLGVGGMGAVYKVLDRHLDEIVALKMLKREIADSPGIAERFRREVKLARRVTHPNVARTFDLGESDGERFLTMELIEGEALSTVIAREGQLPLGRVVDLVGSICAALDAAHAAGVVHRDLKPDNVMLSPGPPPRVVITDFGIARGQEAGAASRTAVPVGTPAYMAPEQVEASPDIDGRADIYALGAMIFELLTGHLPFEADSVFAIAAMRLTQPPPDPRIFRPDLPEPVALLVQRCMARKPSDRPASAREIASRFAGLTLPAAEAILQPEVRAPAVATEPGQKTVAVLPFRNAGTAEDDYLVDGLTDDLIDTLSMTPGLRVRPRGVVMQFKNGTDPRQIGRDLAVQVVVDGTVRTAAESIRVSARVLSVEDGFQIWAKRFEGARADVLRIGDEASRAIADALAVRKPTRAAIMTDPVAVDLYLRGRHEYLKFWSLANERAVDLLKAARDRAPEDPLIMAGYAAALSRQFGMANSAERSENARMAAEEAIRMAPQLAEAHVALANVKLHDPDPTGVVVSLGRALALAPLSPDAHELRTRILSEVASPREAIEAAQRTLQLEPRFAHLTYDVIARANVMLGEWDLESYGEPPPDPDTASVYWIMAARFAMWKSDRETAIIIRDRVEGAAIASRPLVSMLTRFVVDRTFDDEERARMHERGTSPKLTKRIRCFWHQLTAELRLYLGEDALDSVKAAVDLGLFDRAWMDHCPLLEPLRQRPEFKLLSKEVTVRAMRILTDLRGGEATLAS